LCKNFNPSLYYNFQVAQTVGVSQPHVTVTPAIVASTPIVMRPPVVAIGNQLPQVSDEGRRIFDRKDILTNHIVLTINRMAASMVQMTVSESQFETAIPCSIFAIKHCSFVKRVSGSKNHNFPNYSGKCGVVVDNRAQFLAGPLTRGTEGTSYPGPESVNPINQSCQSR